MKVVDGASSNGTHDFEIGSHKNTAAVNVYFAAGSPSATVKIQSRNEAANDDGKSDPYSLLSGAEFSVSNERTITGLTPGNYRVEITGGPSGNIYVEVKY